MLRFADEQNAAIDLEPSPMGRLVARAGIAGDIGQAMGLSEGQVKNRLHAARTVKLRSPRTWQAFQLGLIDGVRVVDIASTIAKLQEPESVTLLDAKAADYASTHTPAELRRWLRDFVVRVEAEHAAARAEEQHRQRYVKVEHGDDGMSWLTAYLPSPQAAAIEQRLYKRARALTNDDRPIHQRETDLFVSWLTTNENDEVAINADIAVVVDADVLAGAREGFATGADGSWVAPASWITEIATQDNPFWWRMLRDPVTQDILSVEYQGRFAPKLLRKALEFKYQTCVHPGCLIPAWKCQIDHEAPWPHGPTRGNNLTPKSTAHHAVKGHGFTYPEPRRSPLEVQLERLVVEYANAA